MNDVIVGAETMSSESNVPWRLVPVTEALVVWKAVLRLVGVAIICVDSRIFSDMMLFINDRETQCILCMVETFL